MLSLKRLSGDELVRYLPELAQLRIQVFRDFPYLYDGDLAYEQRYLQIYAKSTDSLIVLAFDGDTIVGASTGIPLKFETGEVKQPFIDAGYNVDKIFYCGESVLMPSYRGQGVGVAFFEHREIYAREIGGFDFCCFCGVQRSDSHPLRPTDYVALDDFWRNRGYQKQPQLHTTFSWKEINEIEESPKPMTFWMKNLA